MRNFTFLATWALALLFALDARADAIGPPRPLECPEGAFADTNHCGTVCMPRSCDSVADCAAGETCAVRMLCVEDTPCGGWGGEFPIVYGACGGGACERGDCRGLATCGPAGGPRDAGPGPTPDGGGPREDAGADRDGGGGATDGGGTTDEDGGSSPTDAGSTVRRDSGAPRVDSGIEVGSDGGCGCRSAGSRSSSLALLALIPIALVFRRARAGLRRR
jgi:hypothetical protein